MDYKKLAAVLEQHEYDVTSIKIIDNDEVEIDGCDTYKVYTRHEADAAFKQFEKDLYDDLGLDFVSKETQKYFLDNYVDTEWFDDCMHDHFEGEIGCMDEEELKVELEGADAADEDELVETMCGEQDPIEWYKNEYGVEMFKDAIKYNSLLDLKACIEYIQDNDGRGILSPVDGEEHYMNGFYIYQIH